jgi:hypothetical protein
MSEAGVRLLASLALAALVVAVVFLMARRRE